MKRIDFEKGTVTGNILNAAIPMLVAQILNLLYNIVDRIYIARIQDVGTTALGAVGLCFPIIMIITSDSQQSTENETVANSLPRIYSFCKCFKCFYTVIIKDKRDIFL